MDWKLFFIVLFGGWFGLDKLYKGNKKMFLWKLISNLLIVGILWNLYDLVMVVLGKYQVNPFVNNQAN